MKNYAKVGKRPGKPAYRTPSPLRNRGLRKRRRFEFLRGKPLHPFGVEDAMYVIGGGKRPGLSVSGSNEMLEVRTITGESENEVTA